MMNPWKVRIIFQQNLQKKHSQQAEEEESGYKFQSQIGFLEFLSKQLVNGAKKHKVLWEIVS